MHKIDINIFVNQLGNLKIMWKIPLKLLAEDEKIEIQLPSFKYDLPRLGGIPVPFSSKALPLIIDNIEVNQPEQDIEFKLVQDFYGNNKLIIKNKINKSIGENELLELEYEIKEIVNNDTIFFVFVYPLINPFKQETSFDVNVKARFSFNIRKYKFREWYFNSVNGGKIKKPNVFSFNKEGDLITVYSDKLILGNFVELDIHLTGTRFPLMIRRDIFWFLVFIFSTILILSPIWSAIL